MQPRAVVALANEQRGDVDEIGESAPRLGFLSIHEGVTRVVGELDLANSDLLEQVLIKCEDPLLLDLADVTFLDSFALRALVRTKKGRPDMRIVRASDAVRRLLEVTALTTFFD